VRLDYYFSSPEWYDECREVGGTKIGSGNRSTRRNPSLVPIRHHKSHMTWPGIEPLAAQLGSRGLTAWSMLRSPDWNNNVTDLGGDGVTALMRPEQLEGTSIEKCEDQVHEARSSMSLSKPKQILFGFWETFSCHEMCKEIRNPSNNFKSHTRCT
jgi:hypothetical protein